MKIITPATGFALTATFAAALFLHAANAFAGNADEPLVLKHLHAIKFELGASGFAEGDEITIASVMGDREHIEPGGTYVVQGFYALQSADSADLALFCTTRGPSGPTPVQSRQRIRISKGGDSFSLYVTNLADGWLHVSFYPDRGESLGGVYFGEKGEGKHYYAGSELV